MLKKESDVSEQKQTFLLFFLNFAKSVESWHCSCSLLRPFFFLKHQCLLSLLLFADIPDQCSPSPCHPGGTVRCEDKKGDFLCHCFTGWAGARCEKGNVVPACVPQQGHHWSIQYDLGGEGSLCPPITQQWKWGKRVSFFFLWLCTMLQIKNRI